MAKECGKYLYKLMDSGSRFDFKKVHTLQDIINCYPLKAYNDYENKHQTEPNYEIFKNAHKAACELIYLFFQKVGINL